MIIFFPKIQERHFFPNKKELNIVAEKIEKLREMA